VVRSIEYLVLQRSKKAMQAFGGGGVRLDVGMWMPPSAPL
jgi:hypothetical protein